MKINGDKCKILSQDGKDVTIDSTVVEKVTQFNFLGSTIPGTTTDVEKRLAMAYASFGRLSRNVWTNRNFSTKLKLRLLYALIYPIATYACSTWTLTKKDTNKLRVFENNCLRKILGIKLIDRVSIQKLHEKAGSLPVIVNHVKKQRLQWFGHVMRMEDNSLAKKIMKNDFQKKRKRGRPPKRWIDQLKEDTGLSIPTLDTLAADRIVWRRKVNTEWAKSQR